MPRISIVIIIDAHMFILNSTHFPIQDKPNKIYYCFPVLIVSMAGSIKSDFSNKDEKILPSAL